MTSSLSAIGHDEAERLKLLLQHEILDTPPDPAFDELLGLAMQITRAPYGYIGFMDANRIWFKSRFGFDGAELRRYSTACELVLAQRQPLLVPDTGRDPRFTDGFIALTPAIACRSYLGAPLVDSHGAVLGTLALLSDETDFFRPDHLQTVEVLSRQIVTRLEYYNRTRVQDRSARARQRVERALTVERNFVSAVLDTMSALVLVLDTSGRIVRFNRSCEEISGYSFAELVGRSFIREMFSPGDREHAQQLFEQARQGALQEAWQMRWVTRGGAVRRISWASTTLTDPTGEVNFVILTGMDVTLQVEAQNALRISETRYRQLVEGSLGMVCTHDVEGRLLSINSHAAESLGYQAEEMVGRRLVEFIPPQHRPGWAEYLKAINETGEHQGMLSLQRKDGGVCVITYRNKLVHFPDMAPFVLGHGVDVTEKNEAEHRLRNLTRQRESILGSVGDGIFGMDMEGRITFVNRAALDMVGYEEDEVSGCDMHVLLHHSRADGTPYPVDLCPIYRARQLDSPTRVDDEVFWHKDGTCFPVEYVACPLIDNGRVNGIVIAFQDITERQRLDRMKDEFISTVSHELRTPLTSLRAALGLIAGGALQRRPEKVQQMFDVAIGNCDRLVRLVNDILDFERLGSGKMQLQCVQMPARDLLQRAVDLQHSSAQKANITLRVEAEPIDLWVDADRILQTLGNLISNAIKFSSPGSEVLVRASVRGKAEAVIEVRDQGRGIPPEKISLIFERFQQVDASDSRAMGGTGLGLAICRRIVRQHGGQIWVESEVGKGSSFFFTVARNVAVLPTASSA